MTLSDQTARTATRIIEAARSLFDTNQKLGKPE